AQAVPGTSSPPPTAPSAASTPPAAIPAVEQRPGLRLEANPTVRTFTTSTAKAAGVPKPLSASAHPSLAEPSTLPAPVATPESSPVIGHGVPGRMVEGHLVRFSVPQEGTLQFLPGRLEIGAGLDAGREIRFVHVPGPNGSEVTFGRSDGELYRHIQLRDQTVSRSHARMRFADGHWYLLNLSQTNPIVHNSTVVANSNEHVLSDGDRIEMGEVLFTFRSR
ncbi:MAG: FHA domain-containing protein, partial [Gemmatimonas sp.]